MIDWIRTFLIPKDDKKVVRLHIENPYYEKEYLSKMIDYLDRKALMVKAGLDELSPTDIFALEILGNSCYYTSEDYQKWREIQQKVKRKSKKAKLDNAKAQS